jgi:hypothetical protein
MEEEEEEEKNQLMTMKQLDKHLQSMMDKGKCNVVPVFFN